MVYRTGDIVSPKIDNAEPLRLEAEHFLHCVGCGDDSLTNGEMGRRVVAVLEAADASLHEGAPKTVNLPSASAAGAPAPDSNPAADPGLIVPA